MKIIDGIVRFFKTNRQRELDALNSSFERQRRPVRESPLLESFAHNIAEIARSTKITKDDIDVKQFEL